MKRWDYDRNAYADGGMEEYPDGAYVSFEDHEEHVSTVQAYLDAATEQITRQKAEIEALRGHLEEAFRILKIALPCPRPWDTESPEAKLRIYWNLLPIPSERREICPGCHQEIDPDYCGCGDSKEYHPSAYHAGHPFIPMGCDCYRAKPEEVSRDES